MRWLEKLHLKKELTENKITRLCDKLQVLPSAHRQCQTECSGRE